MKKFAVVRYNPNIAYETDVFDKIDEAESWMRDMAHQCVIDNKDYFYPFEVTMSYDEYSACVCVNDEIIMGWNITRANIH